MSGSVLIVGGDGVIGGRLAAYLDRTSVPLVRTTRQEVPESEGLRHLDLARDLEEWRLPRGCGAAVICAGIGSLDYCRTHPDAARHVNVTQTCALASRLVEAGVFVVFLSTNMVYDGGHPFVAAKEAVTPRTEYGRQKAGVERMLQQWPGRTAIVRLTKVFHPQLPLISNWLTALKEGGTVTAFGDYPSSPLALSVVVEGLARILQEDRAGIWQFSGPDQLFYADLARHLAWKLGLSAGLVLTVRAVDSPAIEFVPRFATLDTSRARAELGLGFASPLEILDQVYVA